MIHIGLLHLPNLDLPDHGLIKQLPIPQQEHINRLGPKRAVTFFWSRLFLLELVQRITDSRDEQWTIIERKGLPPRLLSKSRATAPFEAPAFSISHSGRYIAIVMVRDNERGDLNVGIDIEQPKASRELATAKYFCNDRQLRELAVHDEIRDQIHALTTLWTQKEAWFKARQLPILNAQLKSLGFLHVEQTQADLFTTVLPNEYIVSLCGDKISPHNHITQYSTNLSLAAPKPLIAETGLMPVEWQTLLSRLSK